MLEWMVSFRDRLAPEQRAPRSLEWETHHTYDARSGDLWLSMSQVYREKLSGTASDQTGDG